MSELSNIPCWYVVLTVGVTLFHVVRGALGQTYLNPALKQLKHSWQKVVVFYVHDFLLHVVCTVSGFAALFVSFRLIEGGVAQLAAHTSVLLVFFIIVGLAGITGQLAALLISGKLPWLKS